VRPGDLSLEASLELVHALYEATPPAPPLPVDTIDEILLVSSWLRHHREAVNVVKLPTPEGPAELRKTAAAELVRRLPLCVGTTTVADPTTGVAAPAGQNALPVDQGPISSPGQP